MAEPEPEPAVAEATTSHHEYQITLDVVMMTHRWMNGKERNNLQAQVAKAEGDGNQSPQRTKTAFMVRTGAGRAARRKMKAAIQMIQLANGGFGGVGLQARREAAEKAAGQGKLERAQLLSAVRRIYGWARHRFHSGSEDVSVADLVAPLFAKIDADHSGTIDAGEFRLGLASLGLKLDDQATTVLVKHMDDDGNGQLDSK